MSVVKGPDPTGKLGELEAKLLERIAAERDAAQKAADPLPKYDYIDGLGWAVAALMDVRGDTDGPDEPLPVWPMSSAAESKPLVETDYKSVPELQSPPIQQSGEPAPRPMWNYIDLDWCTYYCPCGESLCTRYHTDLAISEWIKYHKPHTDGTVIDRTTADGARAWGGVVPPDERRPL